MNGVNKLLGILMVFPIAASHAELSKTQFDTLFELCLPAKSESAWLDLGWEIDLWAARQRAAEEGKPIFLWEMDGHPLGCT